MIIDWKLSTHLAGGDPEAAKELLTLMIKSLPEELLQIKNALEKAQFDLLKTLLHKLHGALCYCGLPQLKNATNTFENALKNQEKNLLPFYSQLEKAVYEVILNFDSIS